MSSIQEALGGAGTPLAAALVAGLEDISYGQTVTFTKYVKVILPLDGFVFWVKASLLSKGALLNANVFNGEPFNAPPFVEELAEAVDVKGSIHYMTRTDQNEDETAEINPVVFTTTQEIREFNAVGSAVMYIGEFDGFKFGFNSQKNHYKQANLHHYLGESIAPALYSQIIDDPLTLDTQSLVVSNSLPIWLSLNQICPMLPSFLVTPNLRPPYASVHVVPGSTKAIGAAPHLSRTLTHTQLVEEKVKITFYGLRNDAALDFQDMVIQYTLDNESVMGIMDMPVINDEKRVQQELDAIAMKKTFEVRVNYYQTRVNDVARQLILSAFLTSTIL